MNRRRSDDRGATLVEAAISYGLLFLAIFAVVEFGFAFKDWLSVSQAARDGARAGASLGDSPDADIRILRDVEATLAPIGLKVGTDVRIFRANDPGPSYSTSYSYAPGTGCATDAGWSGTPNPLPGCCDWTPCPEVGRDTYSEPTWEPPCRDVSAPLTDRVGVEVAFHHNWLTGMFGSTSDFTVATDFQIEPRVFDAATTACT